MKQQFLVDTAENFQTQIFEDNRKTIPASATITVYRPSSFTKLIDSAAMAVASDGLLSYALTPMDNSTPDENYKAVISYIFNSALYSITLYYDVVRSRLVKVITDSDLMSELPQLKESGWQVNGTAESGTTTTIVDSELSSYEDDYFTGGFAYSIDRDESREITDFETSSGTVTTISFSGAIMTDKYVLTRSYSTETQRAFEKLQEMLSREGKRPHLILDPYDLREVHIYFSVAEVLKGLVIEEKSLWWQLWKEYEKKGEESFRSINFKYDISTDGYIAGSEKSFKKRSNKIGRR